MIWIYFIALLLVIFSAYIHVSSRKIGFLGVGLLLFTMGIGAISSACTYDYFFVTPQADNGGMYILAYKLYAIVFLVFAILYSIVVAALEHREQQGPDAI